MKNTLATMAFLAFTFIAKAQPPKDNFHLFGDIYGSKPQSSIVNTNCGCSVTTNLIHNSTTPITAISWLTDVTGFYEVAGFTFVNSVSLQEVEYDIIYTDETGTTDTTQLTIIGVTGYRGWRSNGIIQSLAGTNITVISRFLYSGTMNYNSGVSIMRLF